MFEAYFKYGLSMQAISILTKMGEGRVRRKLIELCHRLSSNQYYRCRQAKQALTSYDLRVAGLYYRDGKTIAEIATITGATGYAVGKAVRKLVPIAGKRKPKKDYDNHLSRSAS